MIAYLDTSALVKLYIQEDGQETIQKLVNDAQALGCSHIAFVEAIAAFARVLKERRIVPSLFKKLKTRFKEDWREYVRIDLTEKIMERAAELAEQFNLRGYDSVHLASAEYLQKKSDVSIIFACFDKQLNLAAKKLDLAVIG